MRYDGLSQSLFGSIEEVQDAATRWLWTYKNERPNMALGGITPRQKLAMAEPLDLMAARNATPATSSTFSRIQSWRS